jgi:hypothetical protein
MSNLTSKSRRALDRALDNYKRITELSRAHGHWGSQNSTQYPGSSECPVPSRNAGYEDDQNSSGYQGIGRGEQGGFIHVTDPSLWRGLGPRGFNDQGSDEYSEQDDRYWNIRRPVVERGRLEDSRGFMDSPTDLDSHGNRLPLYDNRSTQRDYRNMTVFDAVPQDRDQTRELFYRYMTDEGTASAPIQEPQSKSRGIELLHAHSGNRGVRGTDTARASIGYPGKCESQFQFWPRESEGGVIVEVYSY